MNIRGVVNGVRAVYPAMMARGRGQIVNVASGAGLSTGLRAEAALHGVRVNVLCPGAVETAILDRAPAADLPATASARVNARRYLSVVKQKPVPVDRFARLALAAIDRDKAIIVVPAQARSLWYLNRLSPAVTDRVSKAIATRVDRALVRPPV